MKTWNIVSVETAKIIASFEAESVRQFHLNVIHFAVNGVRINMRFRDPVRLEDPYGVRVPMERA